MSEFVKRLFHVSLATTLIYYVGIAVLTTSIVNIYTVKPELLTQIKWQYWFFSKVILSYAIIAVAYLYYGHKQDKKVNQ